ncbi:MAG: hypothetical protein JKY93_02175 [Gammaproteobacteria bacterium]|nr:hypothetical protein [Gammaproteobacteria bacterium]
MTRSILTSANKNTVRQLSNQAQVAKRIGQFAKSLGVKCRARSDSFSMGDSVSWVVEDLDPATYEKITDYARQYQQGHFNSMEDLYEYSNSNSDIPQTKFCSGSNKFTDSLYQQAWELLKASLSNGNDKPLDYQQAKNLPWYGDGVGDFNSIISQQVRNILRGSDKKLSPVFWAQFDADNDAVLLSSVRGRS